MTTLRVVFITREYRKSAHVHTLDDFTEHFGEADTFIKELLSSENRVLVIAGPTLNRVHAQLEIIMFAERVVPVTLLHANQTPESQAFMLKVAEELDMIYNIPTVAVLNTI